MHDQGNNHDALVLMLQCYELQKEKIGMDHPNMKRALYALNILRSEHPM